MTAEYIRLSLSIFYFLDKLGLILHVNHLQEDNSHEISSLVFNQLSFQHVVCCTSSTFLIISSAVCYECDFELAGKKKSV